ncbi:hypothetical protein PR002_g28121 [Phytophthora rubi]|uniref:Uncharacterized protein n=1 Tax=Phytophthora rubi TaxID=129364 RepID=A0A6A3HES3_9STRA|nr:hypothetical protein PR002_g28121 [Phytophthora rubi]
MVELLLAPRSPLTPAHPTLAADTQAPSENSEEEPAPTSGADPVRTERGRRARRSLSGRKKKSPFAWTSNGAEAMLRLRYGASEVGGLRDRFDGGRNFRELKEAWSVLAAETSRLAGYVVTPAQCKSKHTHMHKLWTQYRASLLETGNRTEEPLETPPCYAVMCDVWGHSAGMGSTISILAIGTVSRLQGPAKRKMCGCQVTMLRRGVTWSRLKNKYAPKNR